MVEWFKHQFANFVLRMCGVALFVIALLEVGGIFEGRFFPVVQNFSVSKDQPAGETQVRIWGEFTIVRPGCNFRGVEWSLVGPTGREARVSLKFDEGSKVRPGGINEFGPWLLDLTERELNEESKAVALHKCPWRFWITETELWP